MAAAALVPGAARADAAPHRYYIEIGGTGSAADAPGCTTTYGFANRHLDGGTPVPVCYPASAGPWLNGRNTPDLTAPSYDSSVAQGYANLLAAVEETHRKDPTARLTIVGYSQGAQAADAVLEAIATGTTGVPRELVNGMLYADPKQPGTGMWAKVPRGVGVLGFTPTGPGPEKFPRCPGRPLLHPRRPGLRRHVPRGRLRLLPHRHAPALLPGRERHDPDPHPGGPRRGLLVRVVSPSGPRGAPRSGAPAPRRTRPPGPGRRGRPPPTPGRRRRR